MGRGLLSGASDQADETCGNPLASSTLVAELLVDVLVHEGSFPDARIAKNDHFEESFLSRRHFEWLTTQ